MGVGELLTALCVECGRMVSGAHACPLPARPDPLLSQLGLLVYEQLAARHGRRRERIAARVQARSERTR